jgi:hypothetical protein
MLLEYMLKNGCMQRLQKLASINIFIPPNDLGFELCKGRDCQKERAIRMEYTHAFQPESAFGKIDQITFGSYSARHTDFDTHSNLAPLRIRASLNLPTSFDMWSDDAFNIARPSHSAHAISDCS